MFGVVDLQGDLLNFKSKTNSAIKQEIDDLRQSPNWLVQIGGRSYQAVDTLFLDGRFTQNLLGCGRKAKAGPRSHPSQCVGLELKILKPRLKI